jgi:hypothetical protein
MNRKLPKQSVIFYEIVFIGILLLLCLVLRFVVNGVGK